MTHLFDLVKLPFQKNAQLRKAIYNILGYYPHNLDLYREALAHKSRQYRGQRGHDNPVNNERLEFLGDAILEATVSDVVYHHFPNKREGFLTNTRSKLVQRETLGKLAERMGITELINASAHSSSHNSYLGGNAFEALVGALYLDHGYKAVQHFVETKMMDSRTLNLDDTAKKETNFKSKLLEWTQKNKLQCEFQIVKETSDSNGPTFETRVIIEGVEAGTGKGFSKKQAEQETARQALSRLRHEQGFKDRVFGGKEKRTAMEATEFAALPRIAEIDTAPNAGDAPATGSKKPVRKRQPRRKPAEGKTTDNRQQTEAAAKQTTDNRQQTEATAKQTTDNRQQTEAAAKQTTDNRQQTETGKAKQERPKQERKPAKPKAETKGETKAEQPKAEQPKAEQKAEHQEEPKSATPNEAPEKKKRATRRHRPAKRAPEAPAAPAAHVAE